MEAAPPGRAGVATGPAPSDLGFVPRRTPLRGLGFVPRRPSTAVGLPAGPRSLASGSFRAPIAPGPGFVPPGTAAASGSFGRGRGGGLGFVSPPLSPWEAANRKVFPEYILRRL